MQTLVVYLWIDHILLSKLFEELLQANIKADPIYSQMIQKLHTN